MLFLVALTMRGRELAYRQLLEIGAGVKTGVAANPAWTVVLRGAGRNRDVRTRVNSGFD